ncbi:hypothetical protein EVAR_92137_1 [Eumeta japonica]|uniref:Uncharacterized protein n=1 Tax=Eumeta variegata TaxID=151549 RepID=A0A4C1T147_EUMVA|nr:hypothetical protein EVAR_92137_1 [Eumeta japonica]
MHISIFRLVVKDPICASQGPMRPRTSNDLRDDARGTEGGELDRSPRELVPRYTRTFSRHPSPRLEGVTFSFCYTRPSWLGSRERSDRPCAYRLSAGRRPRAL